MPRSSPSPVGLVLAAGGSTRMGRPKALLPLDGRPLIVAQVRALAARCGVVRVVLGGHGAALDAALPPEVARIWNPDWACTAMAASIRLGLDALPDDAPVLVTPVDVPPAPDWVLDALLAGGAPALPAVEGQDAHPALVLAGPTREALERGTLRDALAQARRVPLAWPEGLLNFNTPEDWASWRGSAIK